MLSRDERERIKRKLELEWRELLFRVRKVSPKAADYLAEASVVDIDHNGVVALAFRCPDSCEKIGGRGKALVESKLRDVADVDTLTIRCFVMPEPGPFLLDVLATFGGVVVDSQTEGGRS